MALKILIRYASNFEIQREANCLSQAKEAIHALEKEGLHLFQDTLAYDGYLQFSRDPSIEARNNAVLWLQHAHQLARSYVGENDQRVRTMARRLGL